jgi:biopolymer transport protein ExbD
MRFVSKKRRGAPAIIIVSLIDVLLVVLIFMMVSTTFKKQSAIKIKLPTSQTAKEGSPEKSTGVRSVIGHQQPYIYVDDRPVTGDKLVALLAAEVAKNPDVAVQIQGDAQAPMQQYLKVFDAAKKANVKATPSFLVLPDKSEK